MPQVVGLLSLEPWDDVWRRNQHLCAQLIARGLVGELLFVEPATRAVPVPRSTPAGIRLVQPRLRLPRRLGGLELAASEVVQQLLDIDMLWINDPVLGARVKRRLPDVSALYDVTDDWREVRQAERVRQRMVAGEDVLARSARTVVCSDVLRDRWAQRYGVEARVVHNAIDATSFAVATPRRIDAPAPTVGYVGSLHGQRLDVGLVGQLAQEEWVGSVHLIGPDALDEAERAHLTAAGVVLHGPVPHEEVAGYTAGFDVLICPHVVSDFTLSLDAIKAYEYLASGRPVVATPTSGFQHLREEPGVWVVDGPDFAVAVKAASTIGQRFERQVPSWADRAEEFAEELALGRR